MKLLLTVNLYLKVFPFHMLSAWVKHQIVDIIDIIFRVFPKSKNSALCADSKWVQNSIFPNGKHAFPDSLLNS